MSHTLTAELASTPEGGNAFDFIIVGSGPGGGPLAARLALAGKKVLVLEAGRDPRHAPASPAYPNAQPGEVHEAPGYHAAATEDHTMAWMFSVRHYEDNQRQAKDKKYNQSFDPNTPHGQPPQPISARYLDPTPPPVQGTAGQRGIFYPRSAGIGGCTGHHAMIMAMPNDRDWDHIANLTGDDTWRASQMRGYFTKIERCEYVDAYGRWLRKFIGIFFVLWQKIVLVLNPRAILDDGGHGRSGWQPTNFIDPDLVQTIAQSDRTFFNVLTRTVISVLEKQRPLVALLKKALFQFRVVQYLDPNDYNTRRTKPEGVFLIPAGITGRTRTGLREHLLKTKADLDAKAEAEPQDDADTPLGRIVIEQGVHVTRVLFQASPNGGPPRAIGIEGMRGDHLYAASPRHEERTANPVTVRYFTCGEVILCAGAFNTPQLLMLSGIGDKKHLNDHGVTGVTWWDDSAKAARVSQQVVHLPGVGKNLQDRYEVSVISELDRDFQTLAGRKISFVPGDKNDQGAKEWREGRTGLYGTNGGALAVLRRSCVLRDDEKEPDTFSFGAPAAFRGYYWGWSQELLRRSMGAKANQSNLWSWIILKAYTDNNHGTVRLRSNDALEVPDICFHSFDEGPAAGAHKDLRALSDSVKFFREINAKNPRQFANEVQPGPDKPNDSPELDEWIQTQAWGHHACGTCRIGSDAWQERTEALKDEYAVLDSKFRVHGVRNLRVVDASVFPRIPGYFILAPIFMVSEKAAETLLSEPRNTIYPAKLRRKEAEAVVNRRLKAHLAGQSVSGELPQKTVGLALSGGGIRSATFALGVLQALAQKSRLREIDILSTVSGGGFTGGFLGRLFTRKMVADSADPAGRVEELLKAPSAPLRWLRTHANYIFNAGATDIRQNLALYLRNTLTMHLVTFALLFGVFGVLRFAGDRLVTRIPTLLQTGGPLFGLTPSPWWWLPTTLLAVGVLPALLGYWLAPKAGSRRIHPPYPALAWGIVVAGAVAIAALPGMLVPGGLLVLTMLLAWFWQEAARWDAPKEVAKQGVVIRNRLTRALGDVLMLFLAASGWVLLDTLARAAAGESGIRGTVMTIAAALAPLLPLLRKLGEKATRQLADKTGASGSRSIIAGNVMGYTLAVFLLFACDLLAHWSVTHNPAYSLWSVGLALAFSLCLGRAFDFLNLSTLQTSYSARLARTFQGASNEARLFGSQDENSGDVQLAHPDDDIPLQAYHPEANGGPLHLINVCVNETIDGASQREVRERKGLPMCLGPAGASVGRRYHALWTVPNELSWMQRMWRKLEGLDINASQFVALRPLVPPHDPNAFHVLANRRGHTAPVESLSLGSWIGISGAAFSTGVGRATKQGLALFMGIINVRLGHWWDSGIASSSRPGQYPASLWQRLKRLPFSLFRMQSVLFGEWRGRFAGPASRLWHLSDGGHFEVTGLYELIRRRVPFCIATDGALDSAYHWEDIARFARQVRQDFHAEITWLDPRENRRRGMSKGNWEAFQPEPEAWIKSWLNADAVGALEDIFSKADGRGRFCAALARVTYLEVESPFANQLQPAGAAIEAAPPPRPVCEEPPAPSAPVTWILLLKASLTGSEPQDVRSYASTHPAFPQDSTMDQIFDDEQWESYRALGRHVADQVISATIPRT